MNTFKPEQNSHPFAYVLNAFSQMKTLNCVLKSNSIQLWSRKSNPNVAIIDWGNGLEPSMRQGLNSTNNDSVHWRVYGSFDLSEEGISPSVCGVESDKFTTYE